MSSVNTTCFNNKLSDFVNYFNTSQNSVNTKFDGVSINSSLKDGTNIKTIHPNNVPFYNVSPNLFAEYLMEKVFKITTKYKDENNVYYNVYDNFNNSYVSIVGGNYYYQLPEIESLNNLLAGTLFSYQIERYDSTTPTNTFYLNAAILLEEVYDQSYFDAGRLINSINLELRQKEPLMNNITSCNGTVYNFKQGVKLSDFANYIEQGINNNTSNNAAPYGYVNYHSLLPTNLSINNGDLNTYVENENFIFEDNTGKKIYKKINGSPSSTDLNSTCSFTGYLIIGGFYNDTIGKDASQLNDCKPYLTIIRIVRSSIFNFQYVNNNVKFEITSDDLLFRKITGDYFNTIANQGDNKWNIPYKSVLDMLLPEINDNLSNSGECYILKKLTDDN